MLRIPTLICPLTDASALPWRLGACDLAENEVAVCLAPGGEFVHARRQRSGIAFAAGDRWKVAARHHA
jgi:hypothetical protein